LGGSAVAQQDFREILGMVDHIFPNFIQRDFLQSEHREIELLLNCLHSSFQALQLGKQIVRRPVLAERYHNILGFYFELAFLLRKLRYQRLPFFVHLQLASEVACEPLVRFRDHTFQHLGLQRFLHNCRDELVFEDGATDWQFVRALPGPQPMSPALVHPISTFRAVRNYHWTGANTAEKVSAEYVFLWRRRAGHPPDPRKANVFVAGDDCVHPLPLLVGYDP
jgi:hypothetical protein